MNVIKGEEIIKKRSRSLREKKWGIESYKMRRIKIRKKRIGECGRVRF